MDKRAAILAVIAVELAVLIVLLGYQISLALEERNVRLPGAVLQIPQPPAPVAPEPPAEAVTPPPAPVSTDTPIEPAAPAPSSTPPTPVTPTPAPEANEARTWNEAEAKLLAKAERVLPKGLTIISKYPILQGERALFSTARGPIDDPAVKKQELWLVNVPENTAKLIVTRDMSGPGTIQDARIVPATKTHFAFLINLTGFEWEGVHQEVRDYINLNTGQLFMTTIWNNLPYIEVQRGGKKATITLAPKDGCQKEGTAATTGMLVNGTHVPFSGVKTVTCQYESPEAGWNYPDFTKPIYEPATQRVGFETPWKQKITIMSTNLTPRGIKYW